MICLIVSILLLAIAVVIGPEYGMPALLVSMNLAVVAGTIVINRGIQG